MTASANGLALRSQTREVVGLLKRDPFAFSMFLCLLLIGGDRFALSAGGLTLRVVFPLLMTAFFFLYMHREGAISFDRTLGFLFMLLAVVGGISTINSLSPGKSLGYTIWVLFDFFVIISLCYNLAKFYPPRVVLDMWLWVFRIHGFLIFGSIAVGIMLHDLYRPRLWFYETSYLAIFMTAYFGAALYLFLQEGRRCLWDLLLSIAVMFSLASATGIMGMIFCVLLNLLVARQRVKLLFGAVTIGSLFFGIIFLFFQNTPYYGLVAGFLLQPELFLQAILARGGNRYIRLLVGWDAFKHHPLLGVGIGGDSAYLAASPFPEDAWALVRPFSGLESGEPFTNIMVEVLGTMGLAGFIPFAGILLYGSIQMIRSAVRRGPGAVPSMAFFLGFFSSFLALQFDGTFLRYYLWAPLGLALGVMARSRTARDTTPI